MLVAIEHLKKTTIALGVGVVVGVVSYALGLKRKNREMAEKFSEIYAEKSQKESEEMVNIIKHYEDRIEDSETRELNLRAELDSREEELEEKGVIITKLQNDNIEADRTISNLKIELDSIKSNQEESKSKKKAMTVKSVKKAGENEDYNVWSVTIEENGIEQMFMINRPKSDKYADVRNLARRCKNSSELVSNSKDI